MQPSVKSPLDDQPSVDAAVVGHGLLFLSHLQPSVDHNRCEVEEETIGRRPIMTRISGWITNSIMNS